MTVWIMAQRKNSRNTRATNPRTERRRGRDASGASAVELTDELAARTTRDPPVATPPSPSVLKRARVGLGTFLRRAVCFY